MCFFKLGRVQTADKQLFFNTAKQSFQLNCINGLQRKHLPEKWDKYGNILLFNSWWMNPVKAGSSKRNCIHL